MSDSVESRIGEEIAGYRIESVLGRAGTGVVFLAEDTRLERKVALTLLAPQLAADERFRERFLREAKQAASLDHPNILPVYGAGESEGELWIAMRYVEGEDLASLLAREGRLEPERTLLIVTQLAEALDTARWSRGLVHGSLKPSDVLLAQARDAAAGERVFLLGFALRHELPPGATLAGATQHFDAIDYLAPEQIEGRSASPRSDVYALGCLLFACLSGEPPFQGDSAEALLKARLYERPSSLRRSRPDLPAAIERVIEKALAKWPEERYSTCEELAACAQTAFAPGREFSGRDPREERPSPLALAPSPERALPEELPAAEAPARGSVRGPDSWAHRIRTSRGKSVAAIALVALLAALAGAIWLAARETGAVGSATPAPPEVETPNEVAVVEGEASAEPSATPPPSPPPTPADVGPIESGLNMRTSLTVEGVPFSFSVPRPGWERFGSISINKSTVGPQGAEAIIFWTSFPDGDYADPCANLLRPSVGRSATDLAAEVSTAPGTELVRGPSDVTVGGRAAKQVVLTVRESVGCDPGFFYKWEDVEGGALWPRTGVGDTISVWIVDVDGTLLFIEAETRKEAGPALEQEVEQIVESIRFEMLLTRAGYISRANALCKAANDRLDPVTAELPQNALPEELSPFYEAAVPIAEALLAELRALPPPKADRARLNEAYSLVEQEVDALREAAAAAAAGEFRTIERVGLTRQVYGRFQALGLVECPVLLGP